VGNSFCNFVLFYYAINKPTKKTINEATKIFKEVSLEKTGNIPVLKSGKRQDKLSLSSLKWLKKYLKAANNFHNQRRSL